MKYYLLLFILSIPTYILGQALKRDSILIYQNFENLKPSPYLDSIYARLEQNALDINWQDCPDFYFENDAKKTSLADTLQALNKENKGDFEYIAYCRVYVDWEGILREIMIIRYKGKVDIEEIKAFFKNIKFEKLKRMGYCVDSKCVIPIKKNKR